MGFWFFGRKNRRDSQIEDKFGSGGVAHENMTHRRSRQPGHDIQNSSRSMGRPNNKRREGETTRRLTKLDRSMTRDHGYNTVPRASTTPVAAKPSTNPPNPPNLRDRSETFPTPPPNPFTSPSGHFQSDVYHHNPASQSSIGPDLFTVGERQPTLKLKRSSYDTGLLRRKTSKRKAEDLAREQEIRALSSPMPISKRSSFPAGPLRRESKKVPGDLNRRLERPASEISLPLPEPIPEFMENMAEYQHSFKVGTFDMLSPRPTVRYTENPRYKPSRSTNTSRASEKRPVIPTEDTSSKKRIEELADDLDASGLRELMERDKRYKERKARQDQEKLERRLKRRADRQRQQEQRQQEQKQSSTAGPSSPPEGSASRQDTSVGLGIAPSKEEESAQAQQPLEAPTGQNEKTWLQDASNDELADEMADEPVPLEKRSSIGPDRSFLRAESPMDAQMSQASFASGSPPRSPAQVPRDLRSPSQLSGLHREITPEIPEHGELGASRRDSDQSSGVPPSSWATFFRRGTRVKRTSADRGRTTPSEFSNTSRESFARQGPPPTIPPRSFRKSGTPQRTRSKFREDLPDFPLSPPDSRVQSPEAVTVPINIAPRPGHVAGRGDGSDDLPQAESSAMLSQSLASVDSEASWLSGRPLKRSSLGTAHQLRQSETSLQQAQHGAGDDEELANDEYLNRLTPSPENRRDSEIATRRASSTVLGHTDESEEEPAVPPVPNVYLDEPDTKWHIGVARQPTIIRQHDRIKSREGLLNRLSLEPSDDSDGDYDEEVITPGSIREQRHTPILRATSIDYGKGHHVRQISAGSAKLLDLRRSSMDSGKKLNSAELPPTSQVEQGQ